MFKNKFLSNLKLNLLEMCILSLSVLFSIFSISNAISSPSLYNSSDPSAEEQYLLELINRARINPSEEGIRLSRITNQDILREYEFFGIDLENLKAQFNSYFSVQPLAFNASLLNAARLHSRDMKENDYQSHTSKNGDTFIDRITKAGYLGFNTAGENIFAYANGVFNGHVAFIVDYGVPNLGHRLNILQASYREIGIGIYKKKTFAITQDFSSRRDYFITGVVYEDKDGDNLEFFIVLVKDCQELV